MDNQRKQDYNDFLKIGGTQCSWCGKRTAQKYLFPIMFSKPRANGQQLHVVCYECIARENVPKDVSKIDLPWYKGTQRVGNEKIFVSFAGPSPVQ